MQVSSNYSENDYRGNQPLSTLEVDDKADLQRDGIEVSVEHNNLLLPAKNYFLPEGISMADEVRKFECYLILNALRLTGGNQRRAARLLKIKPTTLNTKIKRYKIEI